MFRGLVLAACLLACACTTTNMRVAEAVERPDPGATILLIQPDVELGLLTASGLTETRADWSEAAIANLQDAIQAHLTGSEHQLQVVDPEAAMGGRSGQILRLHEAVGQSILAHDYGPYPLPTKADGFDRTLGAGAAELGRDLNADYALFVYGRGNYASSGRVVTMVALSALGVGIPLGNQQAFVSLVELETGRVIWFNTAVAGPQADMREVEGAQSLVASMFEDAPL